MSLKQTIEKLEDEDDRDELSSDHSEHLQKQRVQEIVHKNIEKESGMEKVSSFLALNKL